MVAVVQYSSFSKAHSGCENPSRQATARRKIGTRSRPRRRGPGAATGTGNLGGSWRASAAPHAPRRIQPASQGTDPVSIGGREPQAQPIGSRKARVRASPTRAPSLPPKRMTSAHRARPASARPPLPISDWLRLPERCFPIGERDGVGLGAERARDPQRRPAALPVPGGCARAAGGQEKRRGPLRGRAAGPPLPLSRAGASLPLPAPHRPSLASAAGAERRAPGPGRWRRLAAVALPPPQARGPSLRSLSRPPPTGGPPSPSRFRGGGVPSPRCGGAKAAGEPSRL